MADSSTGDPNSTSASRSSNGNGNTGYGHSPSNGAHTDSSPMHNQPGSGHGPAQPAHAADTGVDGLLHILGRQWHVVALTTIAALMLSILYLMVARQTYTSVSTVLVTPLDPSISKNSNGNSLQPDNDFLETQCELIKSTAVIELAMDKIRDTRTLQGIDHPADYVQAKLQADPAKVGKLIDVSFESHYPEEATLIVRSIVESYREFESNTWKSQADEFLKTLRSGSRKQVDEQIQLEEQLHGLAEKYGITDSDPEKSSQHQEVLHLREALHLAEDQSRVAHTAYQQASNAIFGNASLLSKVDEAEKHARYSTDPQADLKRYQDELSREEAALKDDSRSYLPNHPKIIQDQDRVDQMIVFTVVAAKDWEETTLTQQEAIEKALDKAERSEKDIAEAQRQYIQLRAELDRMKKEAESVDESARTIELNRDTGALNISVPNPAKILGEPKPSRYKTLLIGMVLGLMSGLGLACVRDWTDDRMRTPQAIRATVGVPVLGAIPAITSAYTAADRGQIVHHEPFGIAAESYRTLRTALQFGLPAGAKTLLITSPVSGDGKSTFVSNLGIAMAQASKKILIIDADLRAPMQHRLFGLKDRIGLASVLGGGGDTLEQAVQHTEIEGLDVLPCGPTPSNPSEMLNSPAFAEHLNELADKYDMVLLDSPPVTAVADARILAAIADVSMLVIRLDTSTRKQAEAARDGLRSVGARVMGVVVNGVAQAAHFGGASGYYQNSSAPAGNAPREGKRPSFESSDPVIDPARRA